MTKARKTIELFFPAKLKFGRSKGPTPVCHLVFDLCCFPNKIRAEAVQKRSATSENLQIVAFHGLEHNAGPTLQRKVAGPQLLRKPSEATTSRMENYRRLYGTHLAG